jgi:CxxC motif-containing protein (DUF1111 family)
MKRKRLVGWTLGILFACPFAYRGADWFWPRAKPVDAGMAQVGKDLFQHEWTPNDPLAGGGDGLGPVFNAKSCVECHRQGGAGGSGPFETNVNVFTIRPKGEGRALLSKARQGVVHTQAVRPEFQETFAHVAPGLPGNFPPLANAAVLPANGIRGLTTPQGVNLSQRKTPALFGAKLIDEIPDRDIIANERIEYLKWGLATPHERGTAPIGRVMRMADGRIGRFGWKAQTVSLVEFVRAACANELGLGNPGQAQPAPLGYPAYQPPEFDLTLAQCDQLAEFIRSLPRPFERLPAEPGAFQRVSAGKSLFSSVGCADCHIPDVGSVRGLYSDLLLHEMGEALEGGGDYNDRPLEEPSFDPGTGPLPAEWRTPPLWGVARSAPYLHDGRAATLDEAIRLHGGQGKDCAERYNGLARFERDQLVAFLKTLEVP